MTHHFLGKKIHFLLAFKTRWVLQCVEGKFLRWPKLPGKPWRLWCLVQVRLFSCIHFTLASCVAYLCWQLPEFWQLLVITLIMTPFPLFKPWLGLHILLPLSVSRSLVSIPPWKQEPKQMCGSCLILTLSEETVLILLSEKKCRW